jgi:hypothetical protein
VADCLRDAGAAARGGRVGGSGSDFRNFQGALWRGPRSEAGGEVLCRGAWDSGAERHASGWSGWVEPGGVRVGCSLGAWVGLGSFTEASGGRHLMWDLEEPSSGQSGYMGGAEGVVWRPGPSRVSPCVRGPWRCGYFSTS